ncbi:hypothetical protein FNF27_00563 [Cafeteria roenbergensis]|uniref:WASH1 WAHD domain-containing protein n=1 Tax=Cafeteria roenbergensis TaxID=33653 RepID=A0A5A8EJF6_CAFRO|nr:hypothetical protein FNF27_00563 [Cafeteria roenbergensis]
MAARVAQVHSVPLAYHDVCQDDAVRLIMESLVALDRTANNIFSAIEDRVAQGKTALASLNGRIDECRGKVQSIAATTTRATTILCPTKFPAGTKAIPFTPALAGRPYVSEAPDMIDQVPVASGGGNPRRMELEEPQDSTTPGMRMATLEVIIESRMLMHPADTAAASETPTGLGQLPRSVGSVADTLLFNSTQVPYKDYARLDNLMRAGRAAQESKEEEEEGDLGAAPATLLEHNDLPEVAGFDLSYRPAAPTVQQLEMPSAIGLPNVADVSWSDAAGDGDGSSDISGSLVSDMSDEDDDLEEPEASPDTGVAYRPGMSLAQLLGRAGDADTGAGAAASPAPAPQPAAAPAPFDLTALPGFAMARSIAASSQVGAEQGGDDGDDDEWDE